MPRERVSEREEEMQHVPYVRCWHLDMNFENQRHCTHNWGCIPFFLETSILCWDLCSNYIRREGPCFILCMLQRGLGEHPLSPGTPLLISAAINQFSSSRQPHQHPPHLSLSLSRHVYCSRLASSLPPSSILCTGSQLWIGPGGSWNHLDPFLSFYHISVLGGCWNEWNIIPLDFRQTCVPTISDPYVAWMDACIYVLAPPPCTDNLSS